MVKYIDSASRVRIATSLASSCKDQEYRAGTVGGPGGASKTPAGPLQIGEIAPIRLYPENPLIPAEKAPKRTQDLVAKFP